MIRLRGKFPEKLAHALLHTEAAEADALAREPMTETFIRDGGTPGKALELLKRHPVDNAALQLAYDDDRAMVPLMARSDAAFARVQAINDVRVAMGFPKQPPRVRAMRDGVLDAERTARATPGAGGRADLLTRIQEVEAWAAVREPTVQAMTPAAVEIMKDSLTAYREMLAPLANALFFDEPYDQTAVNARFATWNDQIPPKRAGMKTPQQQLDEVVTRVMTLWAITDAVARPIGTTIFNRRAQDMLAVLEREHVPKATYDSLASDLSFEDLVAAVQAEQTAAKLAALVNRLGRTALTGANLTHLIATNQLVIPHGRFFPYHGGHHGVEIETELTATWDPALYMPNGMRRWADIHIHYNGRRALQANVRFAHLKLDRTVAGAGPPITGHALIAAAYADGRLNPAWTV